MGASPKRMSCLAAAVLSLLPSAALCEIYRWTDEAGRIQFTQYLGSVPVCHRPEAVERAK